MQKADIIIIGGGPGGYETAAGASAKGKSVILFEKNLLGGTCLNQGCIPTKCLCAAAETIETLTNAAQFGVSCGDVVADYAVARRRAENVMSELREGIVGLLKNVEVVKSEAILLPGNVVEADGNQYKADTIIIATGSKPAELRVKGSEYAIDSNGFLRLENLPERLVIIGAGVIGLEFATVANAFGSKVTIIEYAKEILPGVDSDIAKRLKNYLGRKGIEIITDAAVQEIAEGRTVTYIRKGKLAEVSADVVLAAVGRRPVIPSFKNGMVLPITEKGFIATDDDFRVADNIYAIGDVNGRCMLAHAASAQGRRVLGEEVNLNVIPSVVFTSPECAFVSDKSMSATHSLKMPFSANGKAVASGHSEGVIKIEYDETSNRLVSCSAVGSHAADLIAEASLAISTGMTMADIRKSVHAHPTLSELLSGIVEEACSSK